MNKKINPLTFYQWDETENITMFYLDPLGLEKWMHQNEASYTGEYKEGFLLDNFILSCKRGYAAVYEEFVNCWSSKYRVEFMPYKHRGAATIWDRWAVRMW